MFEVLFSKHGFKSLSIAKQWAIDSPGFCTAMGFFCQTLRGSSSSLELLSGGA